MRTRYNQQTYFRPGSFVRGASCMPLPRSKVFHQDDSKIEEEIIQEGCRILSLQAKPQYADVARHLSG